MLVASVFDQGLHLIVSIVLLIITLIQSSSESPPTAKAFLWVSIVTAGVLSLYHLIMCIAHLKNFRVPTTQNLYRKIQGKKPSESVESETGKMVRNLLGTVFFTSAFISMGNIRENAMDNLIVWEIIAIGVVTIKRMLDTVLDYDTVKEILEPECIESKGYNDILYTIFIHVLLGASLCLHVIKKLKLNEEGANIETSVLGLDIASMAFVGFHLIMHPVASIIDTTSANKSLVEAVPFLSTKNDTCDVLKPEKNRTKESKTIFISLNRIPLIRQIIVCMIIAMQAYVLGTMLGKNIVDYQAAALLVYLLADLFGRNIL